MTKVMSRKQRITLICFALKVNPGDVFSVDGDINRLWRITEENGLESFEFDEWKEGSCWDFPAEGDLPLAVLLTGEFRIDVFPKSPLKALKFQEMYTGRDIWGDEDSNKKTKRRNMMLACLMLGMKLGDVFMIGDERTDLWRITPENGLENFQGCYCEKGVERVEGARWDYPLPGDFDLGQLLLGDYKIKVFPNSPLKRLGFLEGYTGLDFWGDGKCE